LPVSTFFQCCNSQPGVETIFKRMTKYNIKGDGINIGDNNAQVFHKTTSDISKELIYLIAKSATTSHFRIASTMV
jgi:hypothetical protein